MNIVKLGASILDKVTGALLIQAKGAPVDEADENSAPDYPQTPAFMALGLTAMPFQETDDGYAEAIEVRVPGLDAVLIGGRDTRTAKIVKNLKPGDTVVHSTGPQQAAQLQLKEEKRQACLMSKDTRGKDFGLIMDGKADKVSLTGFGHVLEFTRDAIRIQHRSGPSLNLDANMIALLGTVLLGGRTPFAPVHSGAGVGSTSIPTPGVFIGV